jgi:hypothetical protein
MNKPQSVACEADLPFQAMHLACGNAAWNLAAVRRFDPSHHDGVTILAIWTIRTAAMPSGKTPIRSRTKCPQCGGPLYYIGTFFSFFTGKAKRVCLAPNCTFVDTRRFKIFRH